MDEIFEVLTLIQTHKLPPRPVVCLGKKYWQKLGMFIRETILEEKTISPTDPDLYFVTDDPAEAVAHIRSRTEAPVSFQEEVAED